jgi:hypothetical protein
MLNFLFYIFENFNHENDVNIYINLKLFKDKSNIYYVGGNPEDIAA